MKKMTIGIIGLGTVGSGVHALLTDKKAHLRSALGIDLSIGAVCDKNQKRLKKAQVPKSLWVRDYQQVLKSDDINCIIELVGGTTIAKRIIIEAFKHGKDVVTANKALLAEESDALFAAMRQYNRRLFFEASVGGGIPIIKSLRESLIANNVQSIYAIINGTSNYILSRMMVDGMSFKEALSLAQQKGYAEAQPALDVEGIDAAHKITILAQLAFKTKIDFKQVSCEGISRISKTDIAFAEELGYVIKLLAIAKKTGHGIEVRVQPTFLPKGHILANVQDSYNAVFLVGDEVESMLLYGRGAGSRPTASAVVSDVADLARELAGMRAPLPQVPLKKVQSKNISAILSRYYLCCSVIDRPGVLARIASILGKYKVSISDVIQKERKVEAVVPVVLITHEASEKNIRQAIEKINALPMIRRKTQVVRIEE